MVSCANSARITLAFLFGIVSLLLAPKPVDAQAVIGNGEVVPYTQPFVETYDTPPTPQSLPVPAETTTPGSTEIPSFEIGVQPQPPANGDETKGNAEAAQKQIEASLTELGAGLDKISKSLRVTTAYEDFTVIIGGAVIADFLYNTARPLGAGTPFFLTTDSPFGFSQNTFDAHARQSNLFALVKGPKLCCEWDTGALILVNFYDSAIIVDQYGLLPIQAFGEIKNDSWRFAAGLQFDIFNPLSPTILPFSYLAGSGNTGTAFRGQARVERYWYPAPETKLTFIGGISEPISSVLNPDLRLNEDNGWPNLEGRIAWACGPIYGEGAAAQQPIEFGVSGVVGQIRNTRLNVRVVTDVWAVGADCRVAITPRCGIKGEIFTGQTIGTYGGGILQDVNPNTLAGIRSSGGWLEYYYYLLPEVLHTHVGYGIDDPLDKDVARAQPLRNQTYFANLIWDVTKHCRIGCELTYRQTAYSNFLNNEGVGIHGQFQWKF